MPLQSPHFHLTSMQLLNELITVKFLKNRKSSKQISTVKLKKKNYKFVYNSPENRVYFCHFRKAPDS